MSRTLFDEIALLATFDAIGRRQMEDILRAMANSCVDEAMAVQSCLRSNEIDKARHLAHRIAGAAGNCSATALEREARSIEQEAAPHSSSGDTLLATALSTKEWIDRELPMLR